MWNHGPLVDGGGGIRGLLAFGGARVAACLDALRSPFDADPPESGAAALAPPEHASTVAVWYHRLLSCSVLQDRLVDLQAQLRQPGANQAHLRKEMEETLHRMKDWGA